MTSIYGSGSSPLPVTHGPPARSSTLQRSSHLSRTFTAISSSNRFQYVRSPTFFSHIANMCRTDFLRLLRCHLFLSEDNTLIISTTQLYTNVTQLCAVTWLVCVGLRSFEKSLLNRKSHSPETPSGTLPSVGW